MVEYSVEGGQAVVDLRRDAKGWWIRQKLGLKLTCHRSANRVLFAA